MTTFAAIKYKTRQLFSFRGHSCHGVKQAVFVINLQGSFMLPIIRYLARAREPQVVHASFSVTDKLAFRITVCQIAVSLLKRQIEVFFYC